VSNSSIILIKETKTKNAMLQVIDGTPIEREVLCDVMSITGSEYYQSKKDGVQASYVFDISIYDYDNETKVRFNSKVHKIDRTYADPKKYGRMELHCSEVKL